MLREALKQLIDSQPDLSCIAVADNTSDAKRLAEQCKADLMLLDLRLKTGDALDLIKSLRVEHPELKVLVLSQYDELLFAERTLRAGRQLAHFEERLQTGQTRRAALPGHDARCREAW